MDDFIEQISDSWGGNRTKADADYWKDIDSHAAFCGDLNESDDLSNDIIGIQNIKFESDTPHDNAINYKNEGNYYFKKNNYILAISNYKKALSLKINDDDLNCILHTNMAACQYHRGNYRMCIDECKEAIKLNKTYVKAYWRAASAAEKVNKLDEAISFCDKGQQICNDNKELNDLMESLIKRKQNEGDLSMSLVSKPFMEIENLLKSRGVVIDEVVPSIEIPRQHLCQTYVDEDKHVHFNVLILYPEYGQTDFLQDVVESATLVDCLRTIFTATEKSVDWDLNGHYKLYRSDMKLALQTYYKNCDGDMVQVPIGTNISTLMNMKGFRLRSDLVIDVSVVSNISVQFLSQWNRDSVSLDLD